MMRVDDDALSAEDVLRLNVLLAGEVLAVRLDEGACRLSALTPKGEASFALHPQGRAERCWQRVRELLGGHALGSPGGYPVHLRRWTRMGHAEPQNLEALLKLGAAEAVLAVAYAPTLTDELARRVWWALPTMEVARVMLQQPAVRDGAMGRVLVDFLVDHLPFEADPVVAMETVRAVLATGLASAELQAQLWAKAKRRPAYFIGFLESLPDALPPEAAREYPSALAAQADQPAMCLLARCYSPAGQAYLQAAAIALDRPPAHETVYLLLDLLGRYFADGAEAGRALAAVPALAAEAAALTALSQLSARQAEPILLRTTAIGPLMRRHLDPLLAPILAQLKCLQGAS